MSRVGSRNGGSERQRRGERGECSDEGGYEQRGGGDEGRQKREEGSKEGRGCSRGETQERGIKYLRQGPGAHCR